MLTDKDRDDAVRMPSVSSANRLANATEGEQRLIDARLYAGAVVPELKSPKLKVYMVPRDAPAAPIVVEEHHVYLFSETPDSPVFRAWLAALAADPIRLAAVRAELDIAIEFATNKKAEKEMKKRLKHPPKPPSVMEKLIYNDGVVMQVYTGDGRDAAVARLTAIIDEVAALANVSDAMYAAAVALALSTEGAVETTYVCNPTALDSPVRAFRQAVTRLVHRRAGEPGPRTIAAAPVAPFQRQLTFAAPTQWTASRTPDLGPLGGGTLERILTNPAAPRDDDLVRLRALLAAAFSPAAFAAFHAETSNLAAITRIRTSHGHLVTALSDAVLLGVTEHGGAFGTAPSTVIRNALVERIFPMFTASETPADLPVITEKEGAALKKLVEFAQSGGSLSSKTTKRLRGLLERGGKYLTEKARESIERAVAAKPPVFAPLDDLRLLAGVPIIATQTPVTNAPPVELSVDDTPPPLPWVSYREVFPGEQYADEYVNVHAFHLVLRGESPPDNALLAFIHQLALRMTPYTEHDVLEYFDMHEAESRVRGVAPLIEKAKKKEKVVEFKFKGHEYATKRAVLTVPSVPQFYTNLALLLALLRPAVLSAATNMERVAVRTFHPNGMEIAPVDVMSPITPAEIFAFQRTYTQRYLEERVSRQAVQRRTLTKVEQKEDAMYANLKPRKHDDEFIVDDDAPLDTMTDEQIAKRERKWAAMAEERRKRKEKITKRDLERYQADAAKEALLELKKARKAAEAKAAKKGGSPSVELATVQPEPAAAPATVVPMAVTLTPSATVQPVTPAAPKRRIAPMLVKPTTVQPAETVASSAPRLRVVGDGVEVSGDPPRLRATMPFAAGSPITAIAALVVPADLAIEPTRARWFLRHTPGYLLDTFYTPDPAVRYDGRALVRLDNTPVAYVVHGAYTPSRALRMTPDALAGRGGGAYARRADPASMANARIVTPVAGDPLSTASYLEATRAILTGDVITIRPDDPGLYAPTPMQMGVDMVAASMHTLHLR